MKNLLFIISIAALVFSCKKTTTTTTTTTVVPGGNNTNTTNSTGYYSVPTIFGNQYVVSGTLTPINIKSEPVYFYNSLTTSTSYVMVGSVNLNGVGFKFYPTFYQDSLNSTVTLPSTWAVVGAGVIPSFTFTNNNPMPSYSGYASLPDTIYKSQQNTIQINGIIGSDITTVTVFDAGTHKTTQTLPSGVTSLTFSASSLSAFATGANSSINVTCIKNNVQTFSGKQFNFPLNYMVHKTIYIK